MVQGVNLTNKKDGPNCIELIRHMYVVLSIRLLDADGLKTVR